MSADLPNELIELLEKIVLDENSVFRDHRSVQTALSGPLTANVVPCKPRSPRQSFLLKLVPLKVKPGGRGKAGAGRKARAIG